MRTRLVVAACARRGALRAATFGIVIAPFAHPTPPATPRGELLVSTFTAAMHRNAAMSGHVLPVIFSWHLGIPLNELAGAAKGALDPQEFWHAWARGERMKIDLFGPQWDFWAATREPIDTVRTRIGVTA